MISNSFQWDAICGIFQFPDQVLYLTQTLEQRAHSFQRQHVRPIRWRAVRRIMHLHEDRIHAARYSGAGEWFDVLR